MGQLIAGSCVMAFEVADGYSFWDFVTFRNFKVVSLMSIMTHWDYCTLDILNSMVIFEGF